MPPTEPFTERVKRLAKDHGWTVEDVARRVADLELAGASRSSFVQARKDPRKLNRAIIEGAAKVLGVRPDEFPEWRVIVIGDALRLDHGNLDQVLVNARIIERRPTAEKLADLPSAPKRRVAGAPQAPADELGLDLADDPTNPQSKERKPPPEAQDGSQDTGR